MDLEVNVFDAWVFRRTGVGVEYLLLYTSQEKADRYFGGGRFWQIPCGAIASSASVVQSIVRRLSELGLTTTAVWAAVHAYTIYNRRFATMQIIGVYAAQVQPGEVRLDPAEHAESDWCSYEQALARVHYRGLKDGLRSTFEYITGVAAPARELQLL